MKYLVAYKPCGCMNDWCLTNREVFREHREREGCEVREADRLTTEVCPHGSIAAQLAARLAAAEEEKVELAKWLREEADKAERTEDEYSVRSDCYGFAIGNEAGIRCKTLRDVLARIEGKPEGTANG